MLADRARAGAVPAALREVAEGAEDALALADQCLTAVTRDDVIDRMLAALRRAAGQARGRSAQCAIACSGRSNAS